MSTILIVDDVAALADQVAYDLKRLAGYEILTAPSGLEALRLLETEAVDCVILDLEMPGMDGFEVLRELAASGIEVPVLVYTGTGNYERCVRAVQLGARTFIDKAEPMERVVQEIAAALRERGLVREVRTLRRRLEAESPLLGPSAAMTRLRTEIARVAPVPSPVLVLGESGTGKELVAREIHRLSGRAREPFLAVNSAALPEHLVESELFGHERGAFTGAERLRQGAFEAAGAGTLFLDEIGDLPGSAQAKLLRVLEDRQITRVGGSRPVSVEARVVAATHRDLDADVKAGRFRDDLYYRLNVHMLRVPALREHREDVPEIVEHLRGVLAARLGVRAPSMTARAVAALAAYPWARNNVRELRNVIERAMLLAGSGDIDLEDLPTELSGATPAGATSAGATSAGATSAGATSAGPAPASGSLRDRKHEAERRIVLEALERNGWHITRTAQDLGLSDHAALHKIMRRHGISRP